MLIVTMAESGTKGTGLFAAVNKEAAELCVKQLKAAMPDEVFTIWSQENTNLPIIDETFDLYEYMVDLYRRETEENIRKQLQ